MYSYNGIYRNWKIERTEKKLDKVYSLLTLAKTALTRISFTKSYAAKEC